MQRFEDGLDDGIQMRKDVDVPETNDPETRGSEKFVSPNIVGKTPSVLTAIELYDQPAFDRGEVANVEADLMLPAELEISQLAPSKAAPQETFGVGLISPESTAVFEHPESWPQYMGVGMAVNTTLASRVMTPPPPYDGGTSPYEWGGMGLWPFIHSAYRFTAPGGGVR
jgi:hypothetical protein